MTIANNAQNNNKTVAILGHHIAELDTRWEKPLRERGYDIVIITPDMEINADEILNTIDGLLLPGGHSNINPSYTGRRIHEKDSEFDPVRDHSAITLARAAYDQNIPTLGVCRGFQEIIVAHGGKVDILDNHELHGGSYAHIGDLKKMDTPIHPIHFNEGGRLSELFSHILDTDNNAMVNSIHNEGITNAPWQSAESKDLRDKFIIEAIAPDGTIEAISAPNKDFIIGVQPHFELENDFQKALFDEFSKHINQRHECRINTQKHEQAPLADSL